MLYGHSPPGKLKKAATQPHLALFHGTTPTAAAMVLREGLKLMVRQFVHQSIDLDTLVRVGKRKCGNPVRLLVDSALAVAEGVVFHLGKAILWLADNGSIRFIRRNSQP